MNDYYTAQAPRLFKYFDWVMKRLKSYFTAEYGDALTDEIIGKSRTEFKAIIPELPFVGGRENLFTPIVIAAGGMLAISRGMKVHGKASQEMFVIFHKAIDRSYSRFPRLVSRSLGSLMLNKYGGMRLLQKQATRSQKQQYPDDWVFTVTEGTGEDFDWAIEYRECAVIKFWRAQGAIDLLPYCNFGDIAMSKAWGLGMELTSIGEGFETCVAKFKRGRATEARDWMLVS